VRILAFSAAIFVVSLTSSAEAQLVDSVAASSVETYPSAKNGDSFGEIRLNVVRVSAGLPIPLSDSTALLAGVAYELIDVHPSTGQAFQLHAPKVSFGVMHDFSKHWSAVAVGDLGMASDFSGAVGSDDLLLSLTGIVTYALNDSFKLGAGIVYDRRSGSLSPIPALLVQWRISERLRVRGFAPVWLNAEYRATRWLDLGARSTFEGNRFHLGEDWLGRQNVELAYSNLTVGPKVTFNFTDWIHLDLYAAAAVYRRYELFQDDDSLTRDRLAPVVGYGVRFWVAPSGW
jgi:hypothetical protein